MLHDFPKNEILHFHTDWPKIFDNGQKQAVEFRPKLSFLDLGLETFLREASATIEAKSLKEYITRTQSLVAVVGDPIALCSMGKCRKLWESFMNNCQGHKSLLGISYSALWVMPDNVEMKKAYFLNPLAPEFIPRAKR